MSLQGVSSRWFFGDLDPMGYAALYIDPPWRYVLRSDKGAGRSPDQHYDTVPLDVLKTWPVDALAREDAALFMWATNPMLQQALDLIAAWGFVYKATAFTWAKQNPSGAGWHFGLGYWTRQNTERCLLATRGRPKRIRRDVPELLVAPRGAHSAKPVEVYRRIERLVDGPYVELCARLNPPIGWSAWGNEVGKHGDAFPNELADMLK